MTVLNITGGIGAGKSSCLDFIEKSYGALLLSADNIAKELMEPKGDCYEAVYEAFKKDGAFLLDGSIDRAALSKIVFNDIKKLDLLNSIVHPGVRKYVINTINAKKKEGNCALIILEAALLLDEGYDEYIDDYIHIFAHEDIRVERLINSRGMERDAALRIIKSQPAMEEYQNKCRFLINNSGDFEDTKAQIRDIFSIEYGLKETENGC